MGWDGMGWDGIGWDFQYTWFISTVLEQSIPAGFDPNTPEISGLDGSAELNFLSHCALRAW